MRTTDPLTVGEIARRSGFAESAVRYYEKLGLLPATRTAGGQRRFERSTLRRLAFIRAARNVGLSLDEVAAALASLPAGRTPTRADWSRLSRGWRQRLDDQIAALAALRDGLDSCIGCGCLSLQRCAISNPGDAARAGGAGRGLPAGRAAPRRPAARMSAVPAGVRTRDQAGQTTGNRGWSMAAPAASSPSSPSKGGEVGHLRGAYRASADR